MLLVGQRCLDISNPTLKMQFWLLVWHSFEKRTVEVTTPFILHIPQIEKIKNRARDSLQITRNVNE